MRAKEYFICFILSISLHYTGEAQDAYSRRLASSPPMGWGSWNWFGKDSINEQVVREVIDAVVKDGLRSGGYKYIIVDGGWRDAVLGKNGELLPNPKRFPHGIKPLADYAHSKGLKFGVHIVPGTNDCGGDLVGGYGHEEIQIKELTGWGIDFIKLDKCQFKGGWSEPLLKSLYFKWSKLIRQSGRDIILDISAYEFRSWNPVAGQLSRTTYDIGAKVTGGATFDYNEKDKNFLSILTIARINNKHAKYARPGFWNDPDALVTGNQGLSMDEQRAHFALWCIMSAPLILGNDPRNMSVEEKQILENKIAIAVDQDATEQGKLIKVDDSTEIWRKHLHSGKQALLLINTASDQANVINVRFSDLHFNRSASVFDVFGNKDLGIFNSRLSVKVKPHSSLFLLLGIAE